LEKMEHAMINAALLRTGDNRTEAAELLGLSRRTLQRKLRELGRVKRVRRPSRPGA
jgi:DNA-binding NtrC family response regulator